MDTQSQPDAGAGSQSVQPVQTSDVGKLNAELAEAGRITMKPSIRPPTPELHLDTSEIDDAFRELGMARIGSKKLLAHRVIGRSLKEVGAVATGRSYMLVGLENLADANEKLRELDETEAVRRDPQMRLAVLSAQVEVAKSQTKAGVDLVKTAEVDASDDAGRPPAFQPFKLRSQIAVNQAVITVNDKNNAS